MPEQPRCTTASAPVAGVGAVALSAGSVAAGPATARVGVLFDVDDTLVDLRSAMRSALLSAAAGELDGLGDAEREAFVEHFSRDAAGYYDRYVLGEVDFAGQRHLRLTAALQELGRVPAVGLEEFHAVFEDGVVAGWRAFEDVHEVLDALDARGIPYGAVTNNLEAYQRRKLVRSGLERIEVVIGSDTAGAPKPDARSYLAGVTALGTDVEHTLMVGDNPGHDVEGAVAAGLPALLIDRFGRYPDRGAVTGLTAVVEWINAHVGA